MYLLWGLNFSYKNKKKLSLCVSLAFNDVHCLNNKNNDNNSNNHNNRNNTNTCNIKKKKKKNSNNESVKDFGNVKKK